MSKPEAGSTAPSIQTGNKEPGNNNDEKQRKVSSGWKVADVRRYEREHVVYFRFFLQSLHRKRKRRRALKENRRKGRRGKKRIDQERKRENGGIALEIEGSGGIAVAPNH